jgi:hypothetical protein
VLPVTLPAAASGSKIDDKPLDEDLVTIETKD